MDDESDDPAERLYAEGERFDWKQGESPAAATLARVNFQRAAEMGHKGAVRALAHMIYEGHGGSRDREHGLLLLWSAFKRGDSDALEELSDLLATYGEEDPGPFASTASSLASRLEEVELVLSEASDFMLEMAIKRSSSEGGT
jgi:TPR repeat protein